MRPFHLGLWGSSPILQLSHEINKLSINPIYESMNRLFKPSPSIFHFHASSSLFCQWYLNVIPRFLVVACLSICICPVIELAPLLSDTYEESHCYWGLLYVNVWYVDSQERESRWNSNKTTTFVMWYFPWRDVYALVWFYWWLWCMRETWDSEVHCRISWLSSRLSLQSPFL